MHIVASGTVLALIVAAMVAVQLIVGWMEASAEWKRYALRGIAKWVTFYAVAALWIWWSA